MHYVHDSVITSQLSRHKDEKKNLMSSLSTPHFSKWLERRPTDQRILG